MRLRSNLGEGLRVEQGKYSKIQYFSALTSLTNLSETKWFVKEFFAEVRNYIENLPISSLNTSECNAVFYDIHTCSLIATLRCWCYRVLTSLAKIWCSSLAEFQVVTETSKYRHRHKTSDTWELSGFLVAMGSLSCLSLLDRTFVSRSLQYRSPIGY